MERNCVGRTLGSKFNGLCCYTGEKLDFSVLLDSTADPKCLARPSMVPACLIEIALQVVIQVILKATSFMLSFHVSLLVNNRFFYIYFKFINLNHLFLTAEVFHLSNCRVYIHMIWRHHPSRLIPSVLMGVLTGYISGIRGKVECLSEEDLGKK